VGALMANTVPVLIFFNISPGGVCREGPTTSCGSVTPLAAV
jgi:hypothetical protein